MKLKCWFVLAGVVLCSSVACKSRSNADSVGGADSAPHESSAPEPPVATAAPSVIPKEIADPMVFRVPVGPTLMILQGQGLGPIRFGATLATIERLLDAPCTEKTDKDGITECRYLANAIDFTLKDGVLVEIHVHGNEREFHPGKGLGLDNGYGLFNGGFPNGFRMGMYPQFAGLGEPQRIEKVEPGRFPTVEKHYYDNMVIEFDKLANGNIVLGGVVLTKPSTNPTSKTPQNPNKARPKPSSGSSSANAAPTSPAPRRVPPLH